MSVDAAVKSAREALHVWTALSADDRISYAKKFGQQLTQRKPGLAETISRETGKPRWESLSEVDAMIAKVGLSIEAMHERRREEISVSGNVTSAVRYKPHGVLAVFGPFNMPGHLPNGHIVPAVLAGNCVVFKPSELTPEVGREMVECWHAAGVPEGVVNLVDASRETGIELSKHRDIDGVLFTGSVEVGKILNRQFADCPGQILALEMGGNNPLIVHEVRDVDAAAYLTILSAFITSGQRCSCARRLILPPGNENFLARLIEMSGKIRAGHYQDVPEPFMGPVISAQAAGKLLKAQEELVRRGARILLEMNLLDGRALLSPGIIDITELRERPDVEIFGPLLSVIRVNDFNDAMREANNTRYGLVAGLLSDNAALWPVFYSGIRAGVVYYNRQTTGASSRLPFGGVGLSGNHRPSGFWAADYCSYPVAAMESEALSLPKQLMPGIEI